MAVLAEQLPVSSHLESTLYFVTGLSVDDNLFPDSKEGIRG